MIPACWKRDHQKVGLSLQPTSRIYAPSKSDILKTTNGEKYSFSYINNEADIVQFSHSL